eukprot:CAMPEP_0194269050 /NCGR_PEP_ID=MMETSP0169-20130528/3274_1 /TAXON_ID=218684 /ORGANISM="Corethron pennatum, Strain L29A3" /LENGTH=624 /DNA_ID=CAMNT_0039010553 /DNA_START=189 /DNA_END=2063 /DNA_ORIENTATION=-
MERDKSISDATATLKCMLGIGIVGNSGNGVPNPKSTDPPRETVGANKTGRSKSKKTGQKATNTRTTSPGSSHQEKESKSGGLSKSSYQAKQQQKTGSSTPPFKGKSKKNLPNHGKKNAARATTTAPAQCQPAESSTPHAESSSPQHHSSAASQSPIRVRDKQSGKQSNKKKNRASSTNHQNNQSNFSQHQHPNNAGRSFSNYGVDNRKSHSNTGASRKNNKTGGQMKAKGNTSGGSPLNSGHSNFAWSKFQSPPDASKLPIPSFGGLGKDDSTGSTEDRPSSLSETDFLQKVSLSGAPSPAFVKDQSCLEDTAKAIIPSVPVNAQSLGVVSDQVVGTIEEIKSPSPVVDETTHPDPASDNSPTVVPLVTSGVNLAALSSSANPPSADLKYHTTYGLTSTANSGPSVLRYPPSMPPNMDSGLSSLHISTRSSPAQGPHGYHPLPPPIHISPEHAHHHLMQQQYAMAAAMAQQQQQNVHMMEIPGVGPGGGGGGAMIPGPPPYPMGDFSMQQHQAAQQQAQHFQMMQRQQHQQPPGGGGGMPNFHGHNMYPSQYAPHHPMGPYGGGGLPMNSSPTNQHHQQPLPWSGDGTSRPRGIQQESSNRRNWNEGNGGRGRGRGRGRGPPNQ